MNHYNLMRKPIPIHQAMKILDAKAAVDKKWDKLKNLPAWRESQGKSKEKIIEQAQTEGDMVHFTTLLDSSRARKRLQMRRGAYLFILELI